MSLPSHNAKILLVILAAFFMSSDLRAEPTVNELFKAAPARKTGKVERVLRADFIVLTSGEKIRLIGLKAPEAPVPDKMQFDKQGLVVKNTRVTSTNEERAFSLAKELLLGHDVLLEFDAQRKDTDQTVLAYVFLAKDNTFVNAEILRQGMAQLRISPPNLKYEDTLRAAYREAREQRRGIHGDF